MARISKSNAAKFNARTLTKLQAAIEKDPEIDLTTKWPLRYSDRLHEMRQDVQIENATAMKSYGVDDIRALIRLSASAEIIFPLSDTLQDLLGMCNSTEMQSQCLAQRLVDVIGLSKVVWKGPFARQKMVLSCGYNIILKAVRNLDDTTEYTTLAYLYQYKPNIAAPKPLVWPSLTTVQKGLIKEQLTPIMNDLRSLLGEGCKDIRRHLRRSIKPILTVDEFEDFLFNSDRPGGEVFVEVLRQLSLATQLPSPAIVFTHGDLRPENIAVNYENNEWTISGLIDWEYSGFYPKYYQAIRCTNCMAPYKEKDWYLFIPNCDSPKRYKHWWLLDRAREVRNV
ncbi:hypothetical protein BO99DRAFT_478261 [Aspergillus violaceofuscus CBS 115571]|uniref:Aminoglycoside phosphotransferase domain-containing protein n=1 Tax=Aspergillus violaceofuscus (strain CBS 115571) TaxID=1450538 RepID=A0A2V5IWS3_ASPV1|nr:hypothetical protein BO99DRAFT_478261 [Aspergillus violaceofuscus CBS 115571]